MALLPVATPDDPIPGQAADPAGDTFPLSGREQVVVQNTSGVTRTVTIPAVASAGCPEDLLHDRVRTVGNNEYLFIVPAKLPKRRFANAATGLATINYDDASGLQVAVVQVI